MGLVPCSIRHRNENRVGPLRQDRQYDLASELSAIEGVEEVIIMAPQQVIYLKVDSERLDGGVFDKYETAVGN